MLVGYGRVSTTDQNPAMQEDALRAAGCEKLYIERISSGKKDRPQLTAALDYVRSGDTLVVWRLDRLARSLRQLIATVEDLEHRGIALKSITEAIDTSTPAGGSSSTFLAASRSSSEPSSESGPRPVSSRRRRAGGLAADHRSSRVSG